MSMQQNCQLKNPKQDRIYNQIPLPYQQPLPSSLMWDQSQKPNSNVIHEYQMREGKLSKQDFLNLIKLATRILHNEPNVLQLNDPLTIIGDIHGQYYDLHTILNEGGFPSTRDYVDRGYFSCEVITLLLSLKVQFPDRIFLLRGNHESAYCTVNYGFQAEVLKKYDQEIYQCLLQCFNCLPLIAVINGNFAAMHGGISPEIQSLSSVNQVNRKIEVPTQGMVCDIVWSDPNNQPSHQPFSYNDNRGCSNLYNQTAVQQFLQQNNLACIIRAHEVKQMGFDQQFPNQNNLPLVITIFSAPFYGKQYQNFGAVIKMNQNQINFQQYKFNNEEPFFYEFKNPTVNKYANVFKWSLPFISEQIAKIAIDLLSQTITQQQDLDAERQIDSFQRKRKGVQSVPQFEKVEQVQVRNNRNQTIANTNANFQQYNQEPQQEQVKSSFQNSQQIRSNYQPQQQYQNRFQNYNQQNQFQNIQQNFNFQNPFMVRVQSQQTFQQPKQFSNSYQNQQQKQPYQRQNSQTVINLNNGKFDYQSVFNQTPLNPNSRLQDLKIAQQNFQQQNKQTLMDLKQIAQQTQYSQSMQFYDAEKFKKQVQKDQIYEGRFF